MTLRFVAFLRQFASIALYIFTENRCFVDGDMNNRLEGKA